jgi:hypothetical protein
MLTLNGVGADYQEDDDGLVQKRADIYYYVTYNSLMVYNQQLIYTRNHDILSGILQTISDSSPSTSFTDGSRLPPKTRSAMCMVCCTPQRRQ